MKVARAITALLIAAVLVSVLGCAKEPSDEEALRAIDESGILKQSGFTVTAPVTVVEKGRMQDDGSWLVKVKLTIATKMMDGQERTMEKMAEFKIFRSPARIGPSAWKARL